MPTVFVAFVRESKHRVHLLRRGIPQHFIDAGCFLSLVGGHFEAVPGGVHEDIAFKFGLVQPLVVYGDLGGRVGGKGIDQGAVSKELVWRTSFGTSRP